MTSQNILIVEDTESVSLFLKAILEAEGYSVETATTVHEALDIFQSAAAEQRPFKVVLADMYLPDGTGADFINRLENAGHHPLKFVLSADASAQTRALAIAAGADQFFEKPVDTETLKREIGAKLDTITPLLQRRQLAAHKANQAKLEVAYENYLKSLIDRLAAPMSYRNLRSVLHQLKGSAALYEKNALSASAKELGEKLQTIGPQAIADVHNQLREVIRHHTQQK